MNPLQKPTLQDPKLKLELVSDIPDFPTNMAFIGPDDILVLSQNDGNVLRIKDEKISFSEVIAHIVLHPHMSLDDLKNGKYR